MGPLDKPLGRRKEIEQTRSHSQHKREPWRDAQVSDRAKLRLNIERKAERVNCFILCRFRVRYKDTLTNSMKCVIFRQK
jgi:hypothetical protein